MSVSGLGDEADPARTLPSDPGGRGSYVCRGREEHAQYQRLHFLKDDASALITDLAAKERIDLIILGTVCRTSVAGFFIGNTAENILQQVDCSVLTVRPEGFISPVKFKAA